jgi:hypothetical protein
MRDLIRARLESENSLHESPVDSCTVHPGPPDPSALRGHNSNPRNNNESEPPKALPVSLFLFFIDAEGQICGKLNHSLNNGGRSSHTRGSCRTSQGRQK